MNFLGLIQKAGKLTSGYDGVKLAMAKHQGKIVLMASDISENTKDKILSVAQHDPNVRVVQDFTSKELSQALGRKRKLVAVTDSGFSKALIKKLNEGE